MPSPANPLVVFNPAPDVMYPLKGELQDLRNKKGVEVDVKGWGDVMEGASRRECSGGPQKEREREREGGRLM